MNTLVIFLLVLVGVSAVLVTLAFYPLLKSAEGDVSIRDDSLEITRQLLRDLEDERQRGEVGDAEFTVRQEELVLRLAMEQAAPVASPQRAGSTRWIFITLVIVLPLCATLAYLGLGMPQSLHQKQMASRPGEGAGEITPEQIQKFVEGLEAQLKKKPDDAEAAAMLARAYGFQDNTAKALEAYQRAVQLNPKDADLLADYADLRVTVAQGRFDAETMSVLGMALKASPQHIKTLALIGSEAFNRNAYGEAIKAWKSALPRAAKEAPQWVGEFLQNIEEANAKGGGKVISPAELKALKSSYLPKSLIGGELTIDPQVRAQFGPEAQVFIFAKALDGPPMPVAVVRVALRDLPLHFELSDINAVMPSRKLSDLKQVIVGARVSKNGSATPAAGDFEGRTGPVALGSMSLKILIKDPVAVK
jgi:cytochrome c-type biogenesis protein CcmH